MTIQEDKDNSTEDSVANDKIVIDRFKEAVFIASNVLVSDNPGRAAHLFKNVFNHFPKATWKVEDFNVSPHLYNTAKNVVESIDRLSRKVYWLENYKGGDNG